MADPQTLKNIWVIDPRDSLMSCINPEGRYTVRNDIPFVTAAGAELGTTGAGAATGRMVGDLLAEND